MNGSYVVGAGKGKGVQMYRLIHFPDLKVIDVPVDDPRLSKIKFENAVYENGRLRGTQGSIDKICGRNALFIICKYKTTEGEWYYEVIYTYMPSVITRISEKALLVEMKRRSCLNATVTNAGKIKGINWTIPVEQGELDKVNSFSIV